jgi:alpha-tubulin suppressor-like RCC1 family protein
MFDSGNARVCGGDHRLFHRTFERIFAAWGPFLALAAVHCGGSPTGSERPGGAVPSETQDGPPGLEILASRPPGGGSTAPLAFTPVAIAAGYRHTCALVVGGSPLSLPQTYADCWGGNVDGQLGNGTTTASLTPVRVSHLAGVTAITVSPSVHTCELSSGSAYCWGLNFQGELGDGTTTNSPSPVAVSNLTNPTAIAGGNWHTCALAGGWAYCWGHNAVGQLGNGTTTPSLTAVAVNLPTSLIIGEWYYPTVVQAIAVGTESACALLQYSGTVQCWGLSAYGQLGNGTTTTSSSPVPVSNLTGVAAISVGTDHACALLNGGTVKCWGSNVYGQLGNGTTSDSSIPVAVSNLTSVTAITVGESYACALLSGGTVKCWGANGSGQLGDGTNNNSSTPVTITANW